MHKFHQLYTLISLKLFEKVKFSREKSFLDFHLFYNCFRFKVLRRILQRFEMVGLVILILKGLIVIFLDTIFTLIFP